MIWKYVGDLVYNFAINNPGEQNNFFFEEGRFQRNQPYDIEAFVNRQLQDPARIMGNVESSR